MFKLNHNILKDVFNLLFPAFCVSCANPLPEKRHIVCHACYSTIERVTVQQKMAFIERIDDRHFDTLFIKFHFSDLLQKLMHYYKYEGCLHIADYFVSSVIEELEASYDIISCVPLHVSKKRERGFNQSEIIAKKVCRLVESPWIELLERSRYTNSQTRLTRFERKDNMRNAFRIINDVEDKSILLIDDVITTGATLNECANVLKKAGAKIVDVFAIATPVDILQGKLKPEDLTV